MLFTWTYSTPKVFDDIILRSDGQALTGLYFAGSKDATDLIKKTLKKPADLSKKVSSG
ncbi:hypothetical protein QP804_08435 [Aerococcus urinae]|uniref:hypothetical protein n=1 Tax=Aerococcus urinae TaxID=1376 RepID=UPI00254F7ED7|nr:hypothetical protein [Aerococcus urinae]MDK7191252.1 hypothetical protein [Aerococcus urinae]MDK8391049.1 hypothetical protein [Aerococcus urinae]